MDSGAAALALSALVWVRPAAAERAGQAFRLEYWASGRCPDAQEFARQIQTRAPRLRPAEGAEPALGFYVELTEQTGSATGHLTARSSDGREVVREVRGPTCDDVATALALIAALAADPTPPVSELRPATEPPTRLGRARPVPRVAARAEPPPSPPSPPSADRWTFGVGAGLSFESSVAPSPGSGLNVSFDAEGPSGSSWRPLFALSAIRAAASNTDTQGGSAAFRWFDFRLAACPLRWPEETPLFLRPCAFLDAGVLGAAVSLAENSNDESRSWFALGGFGRVEALVQEVVSFQLDGGVTVPLKHDSFSAGNGAPSAFEVPSSGLLGRIGLSYRFQ